jgi:DNA-binding transcriptional MerR regulator
VGDGSYSIEELERLTGVRARTIHYWAHEGLFEGPGAGRGARYTDEHLARLFVIQKLRTEGRPLTEIRTALRRLPRQALDAWVAQAKAEPPKETPKAKQLIASWLQERRGPETRIEAGRVGPTQWQRLALAPGVELHVEQAAPPASRKLVDELVALARRLGQEDTR